MSDANYKIAILLPDLRGGGVERIRLVLANEFARMGYQVEFVLMRARGDLLVVSDFLRLGPHITGISA